MATRVLVNGKIVTVDERFSIASAVAIDGDRVTATGTSAAVLAAAGPGAEVVDLRGRTVIPGLIDNHNHFVRATEHAEVRLDGVRGRAGALAVLGRGAAELAPGQWLLTLGGWHEEQWAGDRRELTLAELDAVAGGRPAFIQAQYDHAVVNTAWLDATGVPAGAESRATGRVGGGLVALSRAASGFPAPADREAAVRGAMSWYNRLGLTTVYDPGGVGVAGASYATIAAMAARGELTLRLLTTLGDGGDAGGAAHLAERIRRTRPFDGDHWYDRIAVGEIYHAAFHWDHPGSPPRPARADVEAAGEILKAAAGGGWPVQTHSVTTRGLDLVLDAYERADRHRPIRPLRWSVTHAEGITAAHLERARRLGVTVQLRSQGVIRAARSSPAPLRLLRDSGLSWGLGTDGTRAAQVNPFITLWWAVTGRSLGGERTLDEPLARQDALIAHTRSNARLMFRENDLGSVRPGLLADLLILDRDYLIVPADEIRDITPVATMVGGRIVHGSLESLLPHPACYRACMGIRLSESAVRLIDGRNYAVLATLNGDGSPQTSVMWIGRDGDDVLFSTVEGRLKHRNMVRDPRVSVTVIDSADPENYVELRGIASMSPDVERRFDIGLSWKYDGKDPGEDRPGAVRVIVRVEVTKAAGYAA
ncbi:MAG: TIGR03618 family F420-dependent PPOX class oxidoreductase [Trebonia sp.]